MAILVDEGIKRFEAAADGIGGRLPSDDIMRVHSLCSPRALQFAEYLEEEWTRWIPPEKTLIIKEEPWEQVGAALRSFFGVTTQFSRPVGHSSDDHTDKWPFPSGLRPLREVYRVDWERLDAVTETLGIQTVATLAPGVWNASVMCAWYNGGKMECVDPDQTDG